MGAPWWVSTCNRDPTHIYVCACVCVCEMYACVYVGSYVFTYVGVRAWPQAVISSLGARAGGGVVRLRRSVSHVVGHGHMLTSGWVPLGPVRARQGSSRTRMGPYLSRTPIRVHRVIRQGSSGPVGTYRPNRPKFGQVQKHQIWSEMGRESTVWPETKTK